MNIRLKRRGFTLVEILTVVFVSSLLLVMLATLFSTGLHHVSRSSGRIEVVRNGRQALDNIQRYLASAMPPINVRDTNDITLPPPRALAIPYSVFFASGSSWKHSHSDSTRDHNDSSELDL